MVAKRIFKLQIQTSTSAFHSNSDNAQAERALVRSFCVSEILVLKSAIFFCFLFFFIFDEITCDIGDNFVPIISTQPKSRFIEYSFNSLIKEQTACLVLKCPPFTLVNFLDQKVLPPYGCTRITAIYHRNIPE